MTLIISSGRLVKRDNHLRIKCSEVVKLPLKNICKPIFNISKIWTKYDFLSITENILNMHHDIRLTDYNIPL